MSLLTMKPEIAASWDHFALDDAYALPPAMSVDQLRRAVGQHASRDALTLRRRRGLSHWENEGGARPDRQWVEGPLHGADVRPPLLTNADRTT